MSKLIIMFISIIVAINVVFLFIYLNKPQTMPTVVENKTSKVPVQTVQNQSSNITLIYRENCVNSTKKYVENIENITNITTKETRFFNKSIDAKNYIQRNWSSIVYDIKGMEKDITNKTVVSVFDVRSVGERNFTLPIVCDENGKIGTYSKCLLNNIPNIPSSCFNFTINLTECETEWSEHFIMDDIQYSVSPPGAAIIIGGIGINKTKQIFNFTISSSRKMLEYFGMSVIERTFSPIIIDDEIFSLNKMTPDGKGGSITRDVNLTGRKNVEFYATVWFKKKCYDKYVIY